MAADNVLLGHHGLAYASFDGYHAVFIGFHLPAAVDPAQTRSTSLVRDTPPGGTRRDLGCHILAAKAQGEIAGMAAVLGALLAVMGVAALFMLMAQEIHRAMGVTAQNVVLRLSGILLAAVAMQFVFDGLAASGILAAGK
jgi:hypothetical protein